MAKTANTKQVITNITFSKDASGQNEFEFCEFVNCIFLDLSLLNFIDCDFKNCNLSNIKSTGARLQNCSFKDCKLLGADFSGAKDPTLELHFDACNLDYSSFDKKKLNRSSFKNCRLHNNNFTQADLSKSQLMECDLFECLFSNSNLAGVDFTTCRNFMIDPEANAIKGAKFLSSQLAGLLYRYDIVID